MYTYKRFTTSKSAVVILLIGLALAAWGVLGLAGPILAESKYLRLDVSFRDDPDDKVRSDGNTTYHNGKDNVIAIAQDRFRFDTTRGASSHKGGKRTVTMNFSHALTADVQSIFGTDDVSVAMDMRLCYKYTEDDAADGFLEEYPDFDGMLPGDEIQATMRIHFSYNGASYGLAFGNLYQFTGEIYQGTDPVTVRREGTDKWTIEAPPGAKAGLCLLDWKNGDPHYENIEMPFMVTLEVQPPKGGKKAPPASNLSAGLASAWGRIKADRQ